MEQAVAEAWATVKEGNERRLMERQLDTLKTERDAQARQLEAVAQARKDSTMRHQREHSSLQAKLEELQKYQAEVESLKRQLEEARRGSGGAGGSGDVLSILKRLEDAERREGELRDETTAQRAVDAFNAAMGQHEETHKARAGPEEEAELKAAFEGEKARLLEEAAVAVANVKSEESRARATEKMEESADTTWYRIEAQNDRRREQRDEEAVRAASESFRDAIARHEEQLRARDNPVEAAELRADFEAEKAQVLADAEKALSVASAERRERAMQGLAQAAARTWARISSDNDRKIETLQFKEGVAFATALSAFGADMDEAAGAEAVRAAYEQEREELLGAARGRLRPAGPARTEEALQLMAQQAEAAWAQLERRLNAEADAASKEDASRQARARLEQLERRAAETKDSAEREAAELRARIEEERRLRAAGEQGREAQQALEKKWAEAQAKAEARRVVQARQLQEAQEEAAARQRDADAARREAHNIVKAAEAAAVAAAAAVCAAAAARGSAGAAARAASDAEEREQGAAALEGAGKPMQDPVAERTGTERADTHSLGTDVPGKARADPNERRDAPDGSGSFTQAEFIEYFGGTAEWDQAGGGGTFNAADPFMGGGGGVKVPAMPHTGAPLTSRIAAGMFGTYDLCEAHFARLSVAEQQNYTMTESVRTVLHRVCQPCELAINETQAAADEAGEIASTAISEAQQCERAAISAAITAMRTHIFDAGIQQQACDALCVIADTGTSKKKNRFTIAAEGGIDVVITAIHAHIRDARVLGSALSVLQHLAYNDNNKIAISKADGIAAVITAMRTHGSDAGVQWRACNVLWNLTTDKQNQYQFAIAAAGGIDVVIAAMRTHGENADIQVNGCGTLHNLSLHSGNQASIVAEGGIGVLEAAKATCSNHEALQKSANSALRILLKRKAQLGLPDIDM
eukprot:g614.t1